MARANTTDWVLFEKENKRCESEMITGIWEESVFWAKVWRSQCLW